MIFTESSEATYYIGVVGRMSSRPVATPETYSGEGHFDEWTDHFESVAVLNEWTDTQMAQWLAVRLVGRALTAFKRLPPETQKSYAAAKAALKQRFEPASKQALYAAEFHSRQKQPSEDWPSFGDDLRVLADKAFPDLAESAKDRFAVDRFLSQLDDPQLAFSERQKQPKTIDTAVTATLELQSHLRLATRSLPPAPEAAVAGVTKSPPNRCDRTADVLEQLASRMEQLEIQLSSLTAKQDEIVRRKYSRRPEQSRQREPVVCRRCGQEGHYARGCASRRQQQQQQQPTENQGN